MTLHIFGAGMAGLLAANMLRRYVPQVHEAQDVLPDNHGALLRFRTSEVARETSQHFRKVRVLKAVSSDGVLRDRSSIKDANRYSLKVTGSVAPRSVLDLTPVDRYIAPPDFLEQMAMDIRLSLNSPLTDGFIHAANLGPRDPIISTIPMPALMAIVGWPKPPEFRFRTIWSLSLRITDPDLDVHQTIYYPDLDVGYYRASITGNQLIIEFAGAEEPGGDEIHDALVNVLADFGIPADSSWMQPSSYTWKSQKYGKLIPIPEDERKEFILAMTDQYNIYSVGRFATWRQILMDDVALDIRLVERMISERSAYSRRLHGR
jgi:hypothetical protein